MKFRKTLAALAATLAFAGAQAQAPGLPGGGRYAQPIAADDLRGRPAEGRLAGLGGLGDEAGGAQLQRAQHGAGHDGRLEVPKGLGHDPPGLSRQPGREPPARIGDVREYRGGHT